jgi:hypothetical protein
MLKTSEETEESDFEGSQESQKSEEYDCKYPRMPSSLLNSQYLQLFEPFSECDWHKIGYTLKKMDCFIAAQFLPEGKRSYRHLSEGILNILPRKFLALEPKNRGILNQKDEVKETLPFEVIIQKSIDAL